MDDATPTVSPAAATPGVASCVCARTTAGGATTAPKAGSLWTLLRQYARSQTSSSRARFAVARYLRPARVPLPAVPHPRLPDAALATTAAGSALRMTERPAPRSRASMPPPIHCPIRAPTRTKGAPTRKLPECSQLVGGLLTARDDFVLRVELPIVTDVSRSVRLALPNLRHAPAIRGVASRGGSFDVPNVRLAPTNRRFRSLSGSLPLAMVPFQERRVRLELPSRRLQSPKVSLRVTIIAFDLPNVRHELGTRPLRFPSVRLDSPIVRMGSRCARLRSPILPLVLPNRRLATSSAGLDSAFITLVLRSERLDLLTGRVRSPIVRQRTTNRSLRRDVTHAARDVTYAARDATHAARDATHATNVDAWCRRDDSAFRPPMRGSRASERASPRCVRAARNPSTSPALCDRAATYSVRLAMREEKALRRMERVPRCAARFTSWSGRYARRTQPSSAWQESPSCQSDTTLAGSERRRAEARARATARHRTGVRRNRTGSPMKLRANA